MRLSCAALFVVAGVFHFLRPELFDKAMPGWIPEHSLLIAVTGMMELLGAVGLLVPKSQLMTGRFLSLFLLAVFPANINMAVNPNLFPSFPPVLLWLRLPLQFVLIALLLWSTNKQNERRENI